MLGSKLLCMEKLQCREPLLHQLYSDPRAQIQRPQDYSPSLPKRQRRLPTHLTDYGFGFISKQHDQELYFNPQKVEMLQSAVLLHPAARDQVSAQSCAVSSLEEQLRHELCQQQHDDEQAEIYHRRLDSQACEAIVSPPHFQVWKLRQVEQDLEKAKHRPSLLQEKHPDSIREICVSLSQVSPSR